jgi:pectate lyase
VGKGYSAGQGPGLYVTARDAFRVYLNGELVVASSAARKAVFVPLTLLPGDNALSIVIAAKEGTPAAAVQLDELERSYTSDTTWKVSTAPARGYAAPGFDDSAWPAASDLGALGTLGACEPGSAFPAASSARWIGPAFGSASTAVLRKVIRVTPIGYGATATGGRGATPAIANTFDDLVTLVSDPEAAQVILFTEGVHDFRTPLRDQQACPNVCTNDTSKTWYAVLTSTGTCASALVMRSRNERSIELGSNKTLVGLGRGAALRGLSVNLASSHNLILRNLAIFDVNRDLIEAGDAFTLDQASDVWIDHCTTKWISDGFTDVGSGSKNVTLSWIRYDGVTPRECGGQQTQVLQIGDSNLTVHHTFFDHVATHAPQVRDPLARVHVFNNLMGDIPGSALSVGCGAQALMEGNAFQRVGTPTNRGGCTDNSTPGLIGAPAGSNFYGEDVGEHHGGDGMEPRDAVFKPPYAYVVDDAETEWRNVALRAGAGGPWARPLVLD